MSAAEGAHTPLEAMPEAVEVTLHKAALIVVDMQNAYASCGGYLDLAGFDLTGIDAVVSNTQRLLIAARAAGVQVFYLQNGWDPDYREAGGRLSVNRRKSNALRVMRERPELSGKLLAKGGWDYALIEGVKPESQDLVVQKSRYSGFVGTQLDSMLRSRGIQTLFFVGVATNVCVETSIRDAFGREYHPIMVSDCCLQAGPKYLQDATIYNVETFFGWTARTDDVIEFLNKQTPVTSLPQERSHHVHPHHS